MDNIIKGKVTEIMPVQSGVSGSGKEWSKQEFVVETMEQYPVTVAFTLFGDKMSLMENIIRANENIDTITVHYNLRSREYNGKWYHNVDAWKVDFPEHYSEAKNKGVEEREKIQSEVPEPESGDGDLPF